MTLQGKVAVVTGGAGGIGSAISRRLAAEGATVIITYSRSRDKAEAVLKTFAGSGHQAVCAPVDDSAAQADLAHFIEVTYGTLDLLVNNAGITQPVPHDDLDAL
ncbi:MAG: SDR family NAD(P)-dependent oxidoreductase, partial [Anaerolineae bacterium]|nr:SDR family NAD(P)-dependent oxidoreductase [Anaerolineae bacterium]